MPVAKRSILVAGGLLTLLIVSGCAGKSDLKLEMTRETVIHPPEISSTTIDPSGKLDTREKAHEIKVKLRGDPGLEGTFDVNGLGLVGQPMTETSSGDYEGAFTLPKGHAGDVWVVGHLLHEPSGAHQEFKVASVLEAVPSKPPKKVVEEPKCTTSMAQELDKGLRELTSYFAFNKVQMTRGAQRKLTSNKDALSLHELCTIYVLGHADEIGGDEYNDDLSRQRAESVVEFLTSMGVENTRIVPRYFGERQPADKKERWKNRRVELRAFNPYGS